MTVEQRITRWYPVTERKLLSDPETGYAGAKDDTITDAIEHLFLLFLPELDVPETVDGTPSAERYIAAYAVKRLLPIARDLLKEGKLSESLSADNGGGSGSTTGYNKLESLDKLEADVEEEIALMLPLAVAALRPAPEEPIIRPEPSNLPTVSRGGLLVDPVLRALERGAP